jgi:hypothetical protein
MVAEANLPLVLLVAFLIGFLPMWAWHRGRMWHVRRQSPSPLAPLAPPIIDAAPAKPTMAPIDPVV